MWLVAVALCGGACSLALDLDDYEFPAAGVNVGGSTSGAGGVSGNSQGGVGGGGLSGARAGAAGGGSGGAPVNPDAPVAVFDSYSFVRGSAYVIDDAVGVLNNDGGAELSAVADAALSTERGGSVALGAAGGFTYTPGDPLAFWGDDYFTYTVENPEGQSIGRVRVSVQPGTVSLADIVSGEGHGMLIGAANTEAPVGRSVAGAGDVNGDGLADVIVGAPNVDAAGVGSAYVIFGRRLAPGEPAAPALSLANFPGDRGFAINGVLAGARLGTSVDGAGDVNGDGYADVIVGAPGPEPATDGGAAYVVFGKPDNVSVSVSELVGGGTKGFRIDGGITGDEAGESVGGAGDVNGDGLADVIVSAPNASLGKGEGYVVWRGRPERGRDLGLVHHQLEPGGRRLSGSSVLDLWRARLRGARPIEPGGRDRRHG